jgi:hypothetical protein
MRVVGVDEADDKDYNGIRYYHAAPYLLIHTDNAGALTSQVVYLPDPHALMSAHPYNFLATNNTTLQFDKGVIKSSEMDLDTAAVPKAIISALEKVAVAAIGAANRSQLEKITPTVPVPKLFRIVVEGGKAMLIGEDGVVLGGTAIDALHGNKEGQ